jgi:hypothetical protein
MENYDMTRNIYLTEVYNFFAVFRYILNGMHINPNCVSRQYHDDAVSFSTTDL